MFKHYLTYTLALSFHRSCCTLELSTKQKERILRSSETLIHHFARAIHTQNAKDESMNLATALICLRDCQDSLDEWGISIQHQIRAQFTTLHGRMEQLVEKAATKEGGQLRMLG